MNFFLAKIANGQFTAYDSDDHNCISKVPAGEMVRCEYVRKRIYVNHKRYFALMKKTFENLPERYDGQFPSIEALRKAVLVEIGEYDIMYNLQGEAFKTAKSIRFDKMDEVKFRDIYSKSFTCILKYFFPGLSPEEYQRELGGF